jgi:hypothetical protein
VHYWDSPLFTKDFEWGGKTITKPIEHVAEVRKEQDARFKTAFGGWSRETEIENEMRALGREARIELDRKLSAIIGEESHEKGKND